MAARSFAITHVNTGVSGTGSGTARDGVWMGHVYRLTLEGELSDRAAHAFEGMDHSSEAGRTVLVGYVRDQAELQGLLQRVTDMGMTLVSAVSDD